MSSEEEVIIKEIDTLREQIKSLKEERAQAADEIRTLKAERRELIDRIKGLKEELRKLREELSKLKEERASLIEERKEVVKRIREIKKELFSKRELMNNAGKINGIPAGKIRAKIDRLEWRIITESLPLEEENRIIKEIARLESLLEKSLEVKKLKNEYNELRAELKGQIIVLNDLSRKIGSLSEKINGIRERIGSLKQSISEIQAEIDERNEGIQERANALTEVSGKIGELIEKYREMQKKLREIRLGRKKAIEEAILNQKKQKVEEKLKKGQRLTFEDLQLLYASEEGEEE